MPGRDVELERLAEIAEEQRSYELMAGVRRDHPEPTATIDDATLLGWIRDGCARAYAYRIADSLEQRRFVAAMVRLGPRFDLELDWAWAILTRGEWSGARKLAAIDARAAMD